MSENSSLFNTSDSKMTKAARAASVYEPPEWYNTFYLTIRSCEPLNNNKNVRFEVYKSNQLLNVIQLGDRKFILFGRNGDVVHVILDHESISRVHAVVVHRNDGEVCLIDLNSTQGTYVGRHKEKKLQPDEPYVLGDGDIIKFGQSAREYRYKSHTENISFFDDEDISLSESLIPTEFGKSYKKQKSLEYYKQFEINKEEKQKSREEREKEILACINDVRKDIVRSPSPETDISNNKQQNKEEEEEDDDDDEFGPKPPTNNIEEEEEEEIINPIIEQYKLPVTHELLLKSHHKWLSALSWDKSGARLVSGSFDNYIKLWDFGGMVGEPHPFREIEPEEGHPIYCISHSPSGDMFIECNDSSRPRIFDRDGHAIATFIRGDTYVIDQNNTCGHTQSVVGVVWHPNNRNITASCSNDYTVRLWDINGEKSFDELKCNKVIKVRDERNKNIRPSCITYNNEGNLIVVGCEDGSIHCWNPNNKSFYRPDIRIVNKENKNYISCVSFNPNYNQLLVRSHDNTMKIYDLRNPKEVLKCYNDLPNIHDTTSCKWNKDGNLIITGTSVENKGDIGKIMIYDVLRNNENDDGKIYEMNIGNESVISVCWHNELNELSVGTGDGLIHMYFNPKYSTKGALLASSEINHVKEAESYLYNCNEEIAPNILPMFQPDNQKDYIRDPNYIDPNKVIKPEAEVGKMKIPSSTFTQYYLEHNGKRKILDGDPRESLLKQDKKAKLDPLWVDSAYKNTQPKQIYMEKTLEEEMDDAKAEKEKLLHS